MGEPLAIKLSPKSIKDIIGQEHLVGKDKIIYNLVKNKCLFSMILYGKPGIGKTSIANAIANDLGQRYRFLNATINSKKDFEVVFEEAKLYNGIILILDEIHRLNKDKQDLLLPYLENGLITLIGMTTSNPYHSINPAIRSRCHLFELKELTQEDIEKGLKKAIKSEYLYNIKIDNKSIKYISSISNNDLRYAYNILELSYFATKDHKIDIKLLEELNLKKSFAMDKNETSYYDTLSALQKSIRGSDVNASIHYLARLLYSEDLESIARRLSVICYEDIGLANPTIGPKLDAAINASIRVGMPEARIILSEIVIEMALSPKSNSAYLAIASALNDIETMSIDPIPENIRIDTKTYKYPHDYPGYWVDQQYLPDNLKDRKYYVPKDNKYENSLKTVLDSIDKLKRE